MSRAWSGPFTAGIKVEGRQVELANCEPIEYDYGFTRLELLGQETVCHVIFGPEGVEPLLGVVALENFGIMVDARTQSLKRLPASPLK